MEVRYQLHVSLRLMNMVFIIKQSILWNICVPYCEIHKRWQIFNSKLLLFILILPQMKILPVDTTLLMMHHHLRQVHSKKLNIMLYEVIFLWSFLLRIICWVIELCLFSLSPSFSPSSLTILHQYELDNVWVKKYAYASLSKKLLSLVTRIIFAGRTK